MGFGDAVAARLFCSRRRSDIEFEIQAILERKMAILDQCNDISATLSNSVFSTGDMHSTITNGNAADGTNVFPVIPGISVDQSPWGTPGLGLDGVSGLNPLTGTDDDNEVSYEYLLAGLQHKEKELDVSLKKMETELEAVKAEEESMKKIADDHAKKDFKIG